MRITEIQRFSLDDGPGIRTTVFCAGCNMKCLWCHNPETIRPETTAVKEIGTNELIEEILKDKRFFDRTGGGVTFSGGEPILQLDELRNILRICKEKNIHTAVETAGNYSFDKLQKILDYIDLIYIDCKAYSIDVHKKCTGLSNESIIRNIGRLSELQKQFVVRIPVIPNVNITFQELEEMAIFLRESDVKHVELLPFHKWGEAKYTRYNIEYFLKDIVLPSKEYMQSCLEILKKYILDVRIV